MNPYRLFDLVLVRRTILSPSLARFTFHGQGVERVVAYAPDQRVKLFFPSADGRPADLAGRLGSDAAAWLDPYRALPDVERPPMRTFTIRALRPNAGEIDIDFAIHGEHGPASRWATRAAIGDRLSMTAPHADAAGDPFGFEWRPPSHLHHVLIAADETAVPAAIGILEAMETWPARPEVRFLAEMPSEADRLSVPEWIDARWLPRQGGYGEALFAAVRMLDLHSGRTTRDDDDAISRFDIDNGILWDTQIDDNSKFYAWIACETRVARDIRLHLTQDCGFPKRSIACMGYWREGRVLD